MAQQFDINNIDRSTWKRYRFDQIAFNISERVEPQQTDLDIYVGLEHLDSDSIHIKRWGTPSDVEGTKLKVYPGDLIFGKRRAYQRKAAVANFEGICSAHAMVLRANPEVIDPQLFPFFIHSDAFMDRAIDISVGSLSPTINWSTLRTQEFLLPPKDQQARLAELLWAGDAVVEGYEVLLQKLNLVKRITQLNFTVTSNSPTIKIGESCIVKGRIGWKGYTIDDLRDSGPYVIGAMHISKENSIDLSNPTFISFEKYEESPDIKVELNDIILVKTGNTIGKLAIVEKVIGDATINPNVLILRANKIPPKYLYNFLVSSVGQEKIKEKTNTTAQPAINQESIRDINVPLVPFEKMKELIFLLDSIKIKVFEIQNISTSIQNIQKHLLNQIFTP